MSFTRSAAGITSTTFVVPERTKMPTKPTLIKPIALVDMDGTLCDYTGAMQKELALLASPGEADGPWIRSRELIIKNKPGFWRNLPPLDLGMSIFFILKELGFAVSILTKGPTLAPIAWAEKLEWVQKHLGDVPLTISHDKSMVYGKVLVDDWPDYITGWLNRRPRGLVICPNQPWNQDLTDTRIVRAHYTPESSQDVYNALKEAHTQACTY